jgi:hypothetical protein
VSIADIARIAAIAAAGASACYRAGGAPSSPPPNTQPAPAAAKLPTTFDGFALGDSFAEVIARAPYDQPCDDDPIEDRRARAMVYGGRSCRGNAFPGGTSVVFIIDHADGDDFARPIRAFGWMGPYYDDKVKLPAKYGDPTSAAAALGKPVASFDLRALHVDQFRGITVLSDHGTIVGFAFGELPPDPERERWRTFDQMYRRYTPRPGRPDITAADCLAVLRHAAQLGGDDPDELERRLRERGRLEREIDECRAEATPAKIKCALAATTYEALEQCR